MANILHLLKRLISKSLLFQRLGKLRNIYGYQKRAFQWNNRTMNSKLLNKKIFLITKAQILTLTAIKKLGFKQLAVTVKKLEN
jgi:hypothetical protein